MKYMMLGTYRTPSFVRVTLGCSATFLVLFWLTNALMYFRSMGFDPQSVVAHYRGSEELFTMPRTYGTMLEVTHAHLAMMSLVLLLVTHLALFFPWPLRLRLALVGGAFGGALLGEASGWLVRFVDPGFAWLKIAGFLILQTSLGILLLGLLWVLRGGVPTALPKPSPSRSSPPIGRSPQV
jgi:hypothetical protein